MATAAVKMSIKTALRFFFSLILDSLFARVALNIKRLAAGEADMRLMLPLAPIASFELQLPG